MKIAYSHLIDHIDGDPSLDDISEKLFQLGHEHEIENNIFNMEFTPNRGDCLSLNGLLRDLAAFYSIEIKHKYFTKEIQNLSLNFQNEAVDECPNISFLKIEIGESITPYNKKLTNYFNDLKINRNNFFTDISNYISYETGQPTHCYDYSKINSTLSLKNIEENLSFNTLIDKEIELNGKNLVFLDGDKVINLAGVMGGKDTACSEDTRSVLIECAYFNPEAIIGKSLKYDIRSEASHKFERNTDQLSHERVLRRFIQIISEHAKIKSLEIHKSTHKEYIYKYIPLDHKLVNTIIGINISNEEFINYLTKLGFSIHNNKIKVPSYRNDIETNNDIAEEIARIIGYDNIPVQKINISKKSHHKLTSNVDKIKSFLVENGFYEVINNPFSSNELKDSIIVDNPLDSNRKFLRTSLRDSLINNLLFNERRQHDSIKLFEISDIYLQSEDTLPREVVGIIASGRLGKNFEEFSKKIQIDYFKNIFNKLSNKNTFSFETISRDMLDSKLKNEICYFEVDLNDLSEHVYNYSSKIKPPYIYSKYVPISEFPSSARDLSFSLKEYSKLKDLENLLLSFNHKILKEVFIFDYYNNEIKNEIKLGFRFVFQSSSGTLTDMDIETVMENIMNQSIEIKGVSIPGRV